MKRLLLIAFCVVGFAPLSLLADDGEWGHLKGRFVYDGPIPKVKSFPVTIDRGAIGDEVADESLVVNETDKGIANVIVYLLTDADTELPVHPSYDDSAEAKVELTMDDGRFLPRVALLRSTQTIDLHNKDTVAYCAKADFTKNLAFAYLVPATKDREHRLTDEEPMPAVVSCAVHPWMRAYILVRANPYMAVSDASGTFEIKNLPVGKHEFRFWHERVGWLREVQIGMYKTDAKGRLTVAVEPGENNLEFSELPPELFETEK